MISHWRFEERFEETAMILYEDREHKSWGESDVPPPPLHVCNCFCVCMFFPPCCFCNYHPETRGGLPEVKRAWDTWVAWWSLAPIGAQTGPRDTTQLINQKNWLSRLISRNEVNVFSLPPLIRETPETKTLAGRFLAVCFSRSNKDWDSYRPWEEGGEVPISVSSERFLLLWKDEKCALS